MPDTPHVTIPDVLYCVSAAVMRHDHDVRLIGRSEHWRVDLPTFYLDSRVQGIRDEAHAEKIVRDALGALGHEDEDVTVYACATLAPVHDRTGTFTYALDLDRGEYVVYRDGMEVGAHAWETDARRQCDDRLVS
jgi:hypothetical protein